MLDFLRPRVKPCSACVLVLGDINRSPRMRYHCISLAKAGYNVKVIAYLPGGNKPADFASQVNIDMCPLSEAPAWVSTVPSFLGYIFKFFFLAFYLFWALVFNARKCSFILIQNPPALPTLPICGLFSLLFRVHLIIDFHNYAFSILALTLSKYHPFVYITKLVEKFGGQYLASASFCVSKAMKKDLKQNWSIDSVTLYDCPTEIFKQASTIQSHDLFKRLSKTYPCFGSRTGKSNETALTVSTSQKNAEWLENRPLLVVSSTSWTPDEDFGQFFDALDLYDEAVETALAEKLSDLIVVVTGKGPLKDHFLNRAETSNWKHISFVAPWLTISDYATLLGSADVGVCCHYSSSGIDLPMKVVDMVGAALPVLARGHYESLPELVNEDNGFVFTSTDELFEQLCCLSTDKLEFIKRRKYLERSSRDPGNRWSGNWSKVALPVFERFEK